ncbi:MAG: class I SAM-dependent methyltransferase [Pseudomonadota bacterium]
MTQLSPRPDAVANADYYHDNRQEIAVEGPITIETKRQKTEADTARRAEDIVALMPEGSRILDVGCGYGFIVERLSALGFDVRGLEPSRSRAALAREVVGVPLLDLAPLQSPPLELGRFDLVTLFQVLEHILDPVPFLAWLRDLISEEGSILIEVPNLDDRMVGAVPSYRDFYWQRAHVGYWTASLLRRALEAAGWTVVDTRFVQRYSVLNAAHWALTGTPQLVAPSHEVDAEFAWLDTFYRGRLVEAGETDTLIVRAVRAPESGLRAGRA